MSEVFRRALRILDEEGREELTARLASGEIPELSDGRFKINVFVDSDPPMLGMRSPDLKFELTPSNLRHVMRLANIHGLTAHRVGKDIYFLREGRAVAWIRDGMFAASEPELFEEIGREVYGLGERRLRYDKEISWLDVFRLAR